MFATVGVGLRMNRLVKDYVQISDDLTLDKLIEALSAVRNSVPDGSEADVKIRGDDYFGMHLCVSYSRPLTDEEAACEARYSEDAVRERELAKLQEELGLCALPRRSELRHAA